MESAEAQLREKSDRSAIRKATADLHRALHEASSARARLAAATRRGGPRYVVGPTMRELDDVLRAARERIERYPGVVGYGLGRIIKDGRQTNGPCITVFVRRKLSPSELRRRRIPALPRNVSSRGRRARIDVVEIGTVKTKAFIGASTGPVSDPKRREGTVGVFATDANDVTVALTAMHVTGRREFPRTGVTPPVFSVPSPRQSNPNATILGTLIRGTRTGVDAAMIALDDPDEADNSIPDIGEIGGWRPPALEGDEGIAARMYGATSDLVRGTIIHPLVHMPGAGLDDAIVVDIATADGDSGAALIDEDNLVLGFLVGVATKGPHKGRAIFCTAAAVVDILNCDF